MNDVSEFCSNAPKEKDGAMGHHSWRYRESRAWQVYTQLSRTGMETHYGDVFYCIYCLKRTKVEYGN